MYLEQNNICYTVLNATAFPPSCPFEDSLSFSDYVDKIPGMLPVWVPVQRNVTNGSMGRFQWIEKSVLYGEEIEIKYEISEGFGVKNCLIYDGSVYTAVSCEEYYSAICAYRPLQSQANNYCQQKHNNPDCFPSDFNATTSCFCITTTEHEASKSEICTNYAEFIHPHQNIFPSSDTCWIGLERDNIKFWWTSSDQLLSYTAWDVNTDFSQMNIYGAAHYSSKWILTPSNAFLSCGICEQTVSFGDAQLLLRYNKTMRMLQLEVHSGDNLKVLDSDLNHVKCFTDTYTSLFKAKYPESFPAREDLENYTVYSYNGSVSGPGFYWCEAFLYPSLQLIRSDAVFVHDRTVHGNEYVLWLTFNYERCTDPTITNAANLVISAFSKVPNSSRLLKSIREMKVADVDETARTSQVIVHITAEVDTGLDREEEYSQMLCIVDSVMKDINGLRSVDKFLSSHFCYKSETDAGDITLHWESINIGHSATPTEICILENGVLARRNCEGNFVDGASWAEFNDTCANNLQRSRVTDNLNDLLESNDTAGNIVANLTTISEFYEQFEAIDIFLISRILRQVSAEDVSLNQTAKIISNVIKSKRSILIASQSNLNSTNDILYYFDRIMISSNVLSQGVPAKIIEENVIILIADIQHNISGIAISESATGLVAEIVHKNTSWQSVLEKEILSAILLPDELIQQLEESSVEDPKLIITVFSKDALFNEEDESEIADVSKVFGVVIPGFKETFQAPIQIAFKATDTDRKKTCGFWKFRTQNVDSEGSSWAVDGNTSFFENQTDYVFCEFWHVTHFAMLILDTGHLNFDEDLMKFLDIATDINCGLSLFGLAGILLTALLFKNWRRNTGNQILINFVFAISLQIVMMYVSARVKETTTTKSLCICSGALLHYSVVSEFCWMLVIAILQFKRFVQVFGGPPRWVLVKACVTGWVLPLVPVVTLIAVNPENYTLSGSGLCYPSYMGFYLALLLPVSLVLVANIIIYIIILSDVFYKKAETTHCVNAELIFQWRLVILLFFMLGITWTFALLTYAYEAVIFLVLFCFTATLQGFVLFMFFIVFNKNTRTLYVKLFKRCCFSF